MYGHAHETLTLCAKCDPWAPRYAVIVDDETGQPLCREHATETMPELREAGA